MLAPQTETLFNTLSISRPCIRKTKGTPCGCPTKSTVAILLGSNHRSLPNGGPHADTVNLLLKIFLRQVLRTKQFYCALMRRVMLKGLKEGVAGDDNHMARPQGAQGTKRILV